MIANSSQHHDPSMTEAPMSQAVSPAPLRVALALFSALSLILLAVELFKDPSYEDGDLIWRSLVVTAAIMTLMTQMFDLLMMLVLRTARPLAQQRVDNLFIAMWSIMCLSCLVLLFVLLAPV